MDTFSNNPPRQCDSKTDKYFEFRVSASVKRLQKVNLNYISYLGALFSVWFYVLSMLKSSYKTI